MTAPETVTWVMLAGMLVLFMQAGFALVTSGLCRAKNAGQIVAMSFLVFPLTILGFWVIGFALMFGGLLHDPALAGVEWFPGHGLPILSHEWGPGVFGCSGFFLHGLESNAMVLRLFFFQAGVVAVAVAIPVSAMAERWSFRNFIMYGIWAAALPVALFGNWVWGGGWLSQLGREFGLGHGYVDFAGSSVAHMAGGIIGLAGASIIGPRIGKFARDGRPRPMPGHNLVFVVLGTLILGFGWFGFNLGPAMVEGHERVAVIVVNTILASVTGTAGAYFVVVTKFGKPDPSMLCNGMLAGLVAISGPCAFVSPGGSVIIGAIAGILVVYSVLFFEGKLRVDDPVGAVSVHGVSGAWGVLSIGLFANGSYGAGWNGVHTLARDGSEIGVSGAFGKLFGGPANDWSQLGAQVVGALTCLIFVGLSAYLWFKVSNLIVPLRARREAEVGGLDLPEMGAECYPDFHITDKGTPHGD